MPAVPQSCLRRLATCCVLFLSAVDCLPAAETDEAVRLFRQGKYEEARSLAQAGREGMPYSEAFWRVEIESLLALGRYPGAHAAAVEAINLLRGSLRLRLIALETARFAQQPADAEKFLSDLRGIVVSRSRYVRDVATLVDIGEAALLLGVDPRLVLENFFKQGRESDPPVRDAFLAAGRLSLSKNDDGLASRTFLAGISAFPDDPEMWAGLAAAFLDGDRTKLVEYATHSLQLNPHHATSRVLLAAHFIDAEDLTAAQAQLEAALAANPHIPEALALAAVIAELENDPPRAVRLREKALATWPTNPNVDHVIGRALSQKYRFAEGASRQRAALALDPGFTPAKIQLAQDLLRLGREEEGWKLADAVHQADGYNTTAYNLTNLRDRIAEFTVLETPHFRIRMDPREAAIYGDRARLLLEDARDRLTEKFGIELEIPTTIEIYPNPRDFAVRTFGMPDNPGFLGVCFGPVVTVNSPATRRANWEAVLWHEFTHVITLTMTRNRMPRWLSEGISVHEETLRDPSWGQRMTADYRERILGGRLKPIAEMSSAFLQASDGKDLQFAYYQSFLVVDFLTRQHGFEKIRALLAALSTGSEINAAIAATIAPIEILENEFIAFARAAAREFERGLDLTVPGADLLAGTIARLSPRSFAGRMEEAESAIESKEWAKAREQLETVTATGGYFPGKQNPHLLLARVCRELGDTAAEKAALSTIIAHESDALEPVARLLAIAEEKADDDESVRMADLWLAINPLAPTPWRSLLSALERLDASEDAAHAGTVLLQLDPADRPAIHYRVGRAQGGFDVDAARRNVLLALEEAPRFRAAHELLATLPPSPTLAKPDAPEDAPPR